MVPHTGMTIRDYFAVKIMAAIIIREGITADAMMHALVGEDPLMEARMFANRDAKRAYAIADAMLAERGRTK